MESAPSVSVWCPPSPSDLPVTAKRTPPAGMPTSVAGRSEPGVPLAPGYWRMPSMRTLGPRWESMTYEPWRG
jgi:hypothetical protein